MIVISATLEFLSFMWETWGEIKRLEEEMADCEDCGDEACKVHVERYKEFIGDQASDF